MSWLKRTLRSWLHSDLSKVPVASGAAPSLLHAMASPDSPGACTVVAIRNGFLVCTMKYNPQGPNHVTATFAATIADLTDALAAELATQRLTQK